MCNGHCPVTVSVSVSRQPARSVPLYCLVVDRVMVAELITLDRRFRSPLSFSNHETKISWKRPFWGIKIRFSGC